MRDRIVLLVFAFAIAAGPIAAAADSARDAIPARLARVAAELFGLQSNEVSFLETNGDTLWLSARRTLSRLVNDGRTQYDWRSLTPPAGSTRPDEIVTAFAVKGARIAVATAHQEETTAGVFGVGDGISLSANGGETWTHYGMLELFLDRAGMTVPGGDTQCFGMAFRGDTLLAAFTTEYVVMTTDFGENWLRFRPDSTNNPQPNPYLGDPTRQRRYLHLNYRAFDLVTVGGAIWTSTNAGINRSDDGGTTWRNFDAGASGITGDFVPTLAWDPANGILWASTQATGLDEQDLKSNPQDVFRDGVLDSLDWDLDRDKKVDREGRNGLSWTSDGGATWQHYIPVDDPAIGIDFRAWDFAFSGATIWAAGTTGGADALLRSDDRGASWRLVPLVTASGDTLFSDAGVSDVAHRGSDGTLWAATNHGLARSTDGGTRWEYILRYPQTRPLDGSAPIVPAPAEATELRTYAFPSPCAPQLGRLARIVFALAAPADVTIDIYDTGGVLARTIERVGLPAGNQAIEWDGRSGDGSWVANGVYLYKVRTNDGRNALGKVMVLN